MYYFFKKLLFLNIDLSFLLVMRNKIFKINKEKKKNEWYVFIIYIIYDNIKIRDIVCVKIIVK